jgi:hypothetical protein
MVRRAHSSCAPNSIVTNGYGQHAAFLLPILHTALMWHISISLCHKPSASGALAPLYGIVQLIYKTTVYYVHFLCRLVDKY